MANYATLKAAIRQVVKTNGNNEITGALLQQSLLSMINSLGVGYQFVGIATPATNPGTPDQNVFYLASTTGTYTNFGGLVLADGEIAILKYNGAWAKDSTGAASLEKVNQLSQKVTDLEDKTETTIVHTKNLADYAIRDDGHFLDQYTRVAAESGCMSIIFPCSPSTTYTISKVKTSRFRVAYFSAYPVVLAQGAGRIASDAKTSITITTAADSKYIFAWIYNSPGETKTMDEVLASLQIEIGDTATEYVAPGWTAVDTVAREILETTEEAVSKINDKTSGLDGVQVTTGAYRTSIGTISPLAGYYYTEPIKLSKGDSVFTDTSIPTVSAVAYVTEVDSQGNFVSVLKSGINDDETISVTIPEDCYISICSVETKKGNFFFTRNGLATRVDILWEKETEDVTIDPATKLPAINENPLATIRRDAGYGSIIRKWGIIGDSLSSGEMQCFNEESTSSTDYKFIDMYQYSTGQVLARLLGAEAYNFSNGGQTAWGWLKSQGVVRDETYIGGVGGGDWRLAQQPGYIKDGYIIALGVNDRGKINNNDYELGNTTQITEYDGTNSDIDDTTTYPKSFVRYYAGIIQRILSVQPKAKIFCVTMPGDNYAEIAQAIRDIVTYFGGNVYLMDIREYIPDGYNVAGFKLQGHLSPMGYAYWAYMYNTYIDWIIRNNGNAFRDTALIGTNYRPDYA